jgi:hypothetical protein
MTTTNLVPAAKIFFCTFALLWTSAKADTKASSEAVGAPFLRSEIEQLNAILAKPEADWQLPIAALLDGIVSFDILTQRTFDDYLESTLEKYEDNLNKSEYLQLFDRYQQRLVQTYRQRIIADAIAQLRSAGMRRLVLGEASISSRKGHVDLLAEAGDATWRLRAHVRRQDDQWKIVDLSIDKDLVSKTYYEMCEDIIAKGHFLPILEAQLKEQNHIVLEDFSITEPGSFPRDWWGFRAKKDERPTLHQIYHVEKENEHHFQGQQPTPERIYHTDAEQEKEPYYLAAYDTTRSIIIVKSATWNPRQYPIMTWCWRVDALPPGADERYSPTNDSAAGIYVMFSQNWLGVPKQLKYVWSSTLAEGTFGRRPRIFRPWFIVAESGDHNLGKWTFEQVDLYRDFKKIYKGKPEKQTVGLGILTDANSTKSHAEAYYADIRVWTREAQEKGLIGNYCGSLPHAVSVER